MNSFYLPKESFNSDIITLNDKIEFHHAVNVLKLHKNEIISIFNGLGIEATGKILEIANDHIRIKITNKTTKRKPLPKITLACAIPKKTKFDYIVEKATELGVDTIIPLITKRTEINLTEERLTKKLDRYKTISINASKQSKRSFIPEILNMMDFNEALKYLKEKSTILIPSLQGNRITILDAFRNIADVNSISFLIGPEGDFTDNEYKNAFDQGCIGVTLGNTILKVETAAFYVLSCANQFYHTNPINE